MKRTPKDIGAISKQRKSDHLKICLTREVESCNRTTGLEHYQFIHQALPEINKDDIDLSTNLLGKRLKAPIIISSMTGGTEQAEKINMNLAQACQELGLGMGLGSQRVLMERKESLSSFKVRRVAPDIFLMANLGAIQLSNGFGIDECRSIVSLIDADALVLHLNPLQEVLQGEGHCNFASLSERIREICRNIGIPLIVKEVGCGISLEVAKKLERIGVAGIDVGGAGGTSWARVEAMRARNPRLKRIGFTFQDWGISTADSLLMVKEATPELLLISSGGIRTGIDIAKSIALGADLVGIGLPLLKPATVSSIKVKEKLLDFIEELRITMLCIGSKNLGELKNTPFLIKKYLHT